MVLGEGVFSWTGIFILAIVVAGIWIIIEMQRFKHKLLAIFLISLIILSYVTTIPGIINGIKIYFSWLGTLFGNLKTITTNVIGLDWSANQTQ